MNYLIYSIEELLVEPDASLYHYIAQGKITIDGVDDQEEMRLTDEAFDILGFTQVKLNLNLIFGEEINLLSLACFK